MNETGWFILACFGLIVLGHMGSKLSDIASELKILRRARVSEYGTSIEEKVVKVKVVGRE